MVDESMIQHVHPSILAAIKESDEAGGVWLKDLKPGDEFRVQTRNTLYSITVNDLGKYFIQGSTRYCPSPTPVSIHGSTMGSMIKVGFIGVGLQMEFSTYEGGTHGVTTSRILTVLHKHGEPATLPNLQA